MSVKIFFCYAHEDELLLNKLKMHLSPLQRMGLIKTWHDRDISAGTKWEEEIDKHLNDANIILLLVSPDFMGSDYCYGKEMQRALERDQRGEARVIPIILRPVYWQGVLGTLQALPTDANPVMSSHWHYQDEALFNVTEGIRKVVLQLATPAALPSPVLLDERKQAMTPQRVLTSAVQHGGNVSPISSLLVVEKLALLYTPRANGPIWRVALSADGQTLVSVAQTTQVWNLSTGQEVRTLTVGGSVALSADGKNLASGSSDGTIKLWNLATGQAVRTLTGHTHIVKSVAFSADGQTLVSGSVDDTIKVWNLSTGQEVRTLTSHKGPVYSVAFSADGQTLVSGSHDRTIKVWNLSTGQEVRTLIEQRSPVDSVALSADGQTLVFAGFFHPIEVWRA